MRREVIRFDAEPVKVKLDRSPHSGIECHGQYGVDWRYSVNGGKGLMYLPTEGRQALIECGAVAGEEVAIRRLGKDRWEAERIAPELPLVQSESAEPGEVGGTSSKPPRSTTRPLPERLFTHVEPEGRLESPSLPQTATLPVASVTTLQHMMGCYCVAVDVAVEVQEYARKKGINIAFTGSDIRAMGITVYIGDNQRLREAS